MKNLDELPRRELERIFDGTSFASHIGIRLVDVGSGTCETELDLESRHLQKDGYVHAGVQATMADHTAGGAAASVIEQGRVLLTVEFKITLIQSAKGDLLTCRSKVLKSGTRLITIESEILSKKQETSVLVSKATTSMAVVAVDNGKDELP